MTLNKPEVKFLVFSVVLCGCVCCEDRSSDANTVKRMESFDSRLQKRQVDATKVLATVNGMPIYPSDVSHYLENGMVADSAEEALEKVIDMYLLADEARDRGYASSSEVISTFKKTLALQFLSRIGRQYSEKDIPEDVLKREYENKKKQLVHGKLRKTAHGLVMVQKGTEPTLEQQNLANQIHNLAKGTRTENAFKAAVEKVQKNAPTGAIVYESLPEFDANDTTFVKPFVNAAMAVDFPSNHVSPVVKTEFGLHVIFVASISEPSNISFEEAKANLARDMFPSERSRHVKTYIEELESNGEVFVYDEVLAKVRTGGSEQ